jgi:hypothetical protein
MKQIATFLLMALSAGALFGFFPYRYQATQSATFKGNTYTYTFDTFTGKCWRTPIVTDKKQPILTQVAEKMPL